MRYENSWPDFPMTSSPRGMNYDFSSRSDFAVFLRGQNPHLNPSNADGMFDPTMLRAISRDMHHGRVNYRDVQNSSSRQAWMAFFEILQGKGDYFTSSRYIGANPRIHLPYLEVFGAPALGILGEETYAFVNSNLEYAGLTIPSYAEILPETRSFQQSGLDFRRRYGGADDDELAF